MSETTNPGSRTPEEIERDVEHTRMRVQETLGEIRDRLTPGQIVDQLMDYARGSGGADFTRNLGAAVRDNPVPLLLIGTGIGWMMMSGSRPQHHAVRTAPSDRALRPMSTPPMPPDMGGTAGMRPEDRGPSMTDRMKSAADAAKESAASAGGRISDTASSAYQGVSDAASSTYHGAAQAASSAYQGMGDMASEAWHGTRDAGRYAGDAASRGLGWLVNDQPFVLGAIGMAIGAALGAALPRTETEDRMMGEASDDLVRRVKHAARDGAEQVRERVEQKIGEAQGALAGTYGDAKDRLERSGVSVRGTGSALGEVAHEVGEAVRGTVRDTADEARRGMGEGQQGKASSSAEGGRQETGPAKPASRSTSDPLPDGTKTSPL